MKFVFCSSCGTKLIVTRKAMPKYGCILDLIDQHECTAEFIEPDLTPVNVPTFVHNTETKKFAKRLDELQPLVPFKINETGELKDMRDEKDVRQDAKTSAPTNLLDHLKRELE